MDDALMRRWMAVAVVVVWWAAAPAALAETFTAGPADYREAVSRLGPGDRLRLEAGVYTDGLRLHGVQGAPRAPVTIEGPPPGEEPAVFLASRGRNTVSLANVAYVVIRDLRLDGRGLPVDAVKAEGDADYAHHVTLEGLRISGHDNHQQNVGISTKCPAWDWVIRGNVIDGAGTGIYLGDSDGSDAFVGGLIEDNVIRGTIGYNLQIKHQRERADVTGMPRGPRTTVIRHNRFSKGGTSATGNMARPNLLVGDFPAEGPGEFDRYLIHGNFLHQNPTEALIQASGRVAIYGNLLVNTTPDGMALRLTPHKGRLRYTEVFRNTIVASGRGVGIWEPDPEGRHWIGANAIFAGRPLDGQYDGAWNVLGPLEAAEDALRAPLSRRSQLDLHPREGRLEVESVPAGALVAHPGAAADIDGRAYPAGRVGAYAGPAPDGAWAPADPGPPGPRPVP